MIDSGRRFILIAPQNLFTIFGFRCNLWGEETSHQTTTVDLTTTGWAPTKSRLLDRRRLGSRSNGRVRSRRLITRQAWSGLEQMFLACVRAGQLP